MKQLLITFTLLATFGILGACSEEPSNKEKAKAAIEDTANSIKNTSKTLSEVAADEVNEIKEKSAETMEKVKAESKEAIEQVKSSSGEAIEKTKTGISDAKEKTKEAYNNTLEKLKSE